MPEPMSKTLIQQGGLSAMALVNLQHQYESTGTDSDPFIIAEAETWDRDELMAMVCFVIGMIHGHGHMMAEFTEQTFPQWAAGMSATIVTLTAAQAGPAASEG